MQCTNDMEGNTNKYNRSKLWIAGILVLAGFYMARLSYTVARNTFAYMLLIIGVICIISGLVVFWQNFRE